MAEAAPLPDAAEEAGPRGSNQAGMRAWNERLVLSLVRREGALAKSDIARMTGLSAQTVSVIMRALEQDGFLLRGDPVRGRIGQPSVPMRLAPEGALFLGLKLGRRSADLTLVDFLGGVRATRRRLWRWPTPDGVMAFAAAALPEVTADLTPDLRARIGGMGVAMPFQLWNWVDFIGAPQAEMDAWRTRDIGADLAALSGLPVHVQNDATAACGAEIVFGTGERPRNFLYFYVGFFIGGGLVLNGQLYTGRTGNAAGVGPMPVPGPDGRMRRLLDVASLFTLARAWEAQGGTPDRLWHDPHDWRIPPAILDAWIAESGEALAAAVMSATGLLELEAVIFDGWMPARIRAALTAAAAAAFARLDPAGISPPAFREGTVGPDARALGAAAAPLSLRYMIDGWSG